MSQIKLIVGLGNPGPEYSMNRHNIGFMIIDAIIHNYDLPQLKTKNKSLISSGLIDNNKIILCKPQTYMNLSGGAVLELMSFYKIKPEEIIVIHDELMLEKGKIRIKIGGGHAGHNGLRDIDTKIGKNYHRLRVGIGHPGTKTKVQSHVLSNFSNDEQENFVIPLLQNISEHIPLLINGRMDLFQTRVIEALKNDP